GHLQLVGRKARHRQGDPDPAVSAVLHIVGGIALGGRLGGALDETAGVLEAQKERAVEKYRPIHPRRVLVESDSPARPPGSGAAQPDKDYLGTGGLGFNAGRYCTVKGTAGDSK